jgi:2-hydroxychromene-2-carboxylate isomerase
MNESATPSSAAPSSPPVSYDAEFFLDPACPWCWITSRWVTNVQAERELTVGWRFISLNVLNEANYDDANNEYAARHREGHLNSLKMLRVLHAVREREGNDAVAKLYTALGTALHVHQRYDDTRADLHGFVAECLGTAGFDGEFVDALDDEARDAALRAETEEALERTGPDVGTPIITFRPGTESARSFFGPVMPKAPKGDDAVALWNAVATIASSDVAELKRTLRGELAFD